MVRVRNKGMAQWLGINVICALLAPALTILSQLTYKIHLERPAADLRIRLHAGSGEGGDTVKKTDGCCKRVYCLTP